MNKSNQSHIKNIIALSTAPLISQILGLVLTPIITRLYSPGDFGFLNLFSSIAGVVIIFSTLGYHNAIILPKDNKKSYHVFFLSIFLSFIISLLFLFFFVILNKYFVVLDGDFSFTVVVILTLFIFLHGLYQSLRYLNIRHSEFFNLSLSRISDTLVNKFSALYFGFNGILSLGLIHSLLIAAIAKNLFLIRSKVSEILLFLKNDLDYKSFYYIIIRYKKFPKFSLFSQLLSRLPALIIATFIVKLYGETSLGYYSLALMVISLPTVFISNSILEAFTPSFAKSIRNNTHLALLEKVNLRLVSILLFPFIILAFFGSLLFQIIFGENWILAGYLCQILTIKAFFEIIFTPSLQLINILEKQEINLYRRITNLILIFFSIILGYYFDSFILTILFISISEGLSSFIFGYYIMHLIKHSLFNILNKSFIYLFISGFLVLILYIICFFVNEWIIILLSFLLSFIIYNLILLYIDIDLRKKIIESFKFLKNV